jgi:hypothetical protein
MKQYVLNIITPATDRRPSEEQLAPVMRELDTLRQEMVDAGAFVFSGGLSAPSNATVVRLRDGDVLTTDGPYIEGKEYVGGFTIIKAPDLDAALAWGRKLARALTFDHVDGLPVEVRPFEGEVAA